MAQTYAFENLTVPVEMAPYTVEFPLMEEGDNKYVEITQPYSIYTNNYVPATIGTPMSSSFGVVYCAGDYQHKGTNTPVMLFDRKYSNKPYDSVSGSISGSASGITYEYETYAMQYPGYYSYLIEWAGRNPPVITVNSRIEKKYYVIGVDVASPDLIPIVQEQRYYYVDYSAVNYISPAEMYLTDGGAGVQTSVPSLATWKTWVDENLSGSATRFRVCAEASSVEKFSGNIYVRKTRYVPAM